MRVLCLILTAAVTVSLLQAETTHTQPTSNPKEQDSISRIAALENTIRDLQGQLTDQRVSAARNQDLQLWRVEVRERLSVFEKRLEELKNELARLDAKPLAFSDQTLYEETLAGRNGAIYLPRPANQPETAAETANASTAGPEVAVDPALRISGFMDGVYEMQARGHKPNRAYLNQVEIDLLRDVSHRTNLALSLCYSDAIYVGVATITQTIIPEPDVASRRVIRGWAVTGGQLDIPFGLDYQSYCSNVRANITAPAIVRATHGGWNDLTLMNALSTRWGEVQAYATRGFQSTVWGSEEPLTGDVHDDDERWVVSTPSYSGGLRLNLPITGGLEVGGSAARGWLSSGANSMTITGIHAQGTWNSFTAKAEGIKCTHAESLYPESVRGYYVELKESFGRWYGLGRADYVERSSTGVTHGYSLGSGVTVVKGLQCRAEYRHVMPESEGTTFLQFVAEF